MFVTPWIAARQASPSITNYQSLPKLMSIESVMQSSHLILCCPLLLLPPIPPSIRVFSKDSMLHMRWEKYWSFSFSITPFSDHPGLISFIFYFLLFFNFTILYWFCHISTWIRHMYTHVPHPESSSLLPPRTIPLSRPSAPAPNIQYYASILDWWLISYMILYMFQCHSPKSSHPLPLPQSPKDCSIHQCLLISFRMDSWISLQSKEISRVFSNTTVQKHQFFDSQLSSQSNSHTHTWHWKNHSLD